MRAVGSFGVGMVSGWFLVLVLRGGGRLGRCGGVCVGAGGLRVGSCGGDMVRLNVGGVSVCLKGVGYVRALEYMGAVVRCGGEVFDL